jgi:hypothetical protein
MIVGTVSTLNVTMMDSHGNLVDNKNPAETHTLTIHMPGDDGRGLWNGSAFAPEIDASTNADGNAQAQFRTGNISGYMSNYFYADPIGNMVGAPYAYLTTIADPDPLYIVQSYPSPSALPTDGTSKFSFYYTILDKYGNKIIETPVEISTSDGGYAVRKTNEDGFAYTSFGPKDFIGIYKISAGAVNNSSAVCQDTLEIGNCTQNVEYYNTDPVDLMVMANPASMASLDVDPSAYGTIQARVVDIKGNPVIGQDVSFSVGTPSYPGGPYHPTSDPYLSATSATTGVGGFATVTFKPGSFAAYNLSDPLYNATATGQVVVTASWTNLSGTVITRDVTFVWKNYPYLGISNSCDVACKDVAVGNEINLTIQLVGDGAALKPKPINAVLVMDVSGSMGTGMNGPDGWKTRLYYSNMSGYTFVDQMDSSQDKIGLVTYSQAASVKQTLSTNFAAVRSALSAMATGASTNERMGTYYGLDDLMKTPADPTKTVRAVIVMTDGEYNYDGDMLARGTGSYIHLYEGSYGGINWYAIPALNTPTRETDPRQNMSSWAIDNGVKIYTVTFGTGLNAVTLATNEDMATLTGGKHYHADTGTEALDVYEKIAGELKETAGGNTEVSMDFQSIKVNDIMGGGDARYYMKYIADSTPAPTGPLPTDSTYLNKTHWFSGNSTMTWYTGFPMVVDNTADWDAGTMAFTPGDIKLADTWAATFRLRLNNSGKIELFGPDSASQVCFTDASTDTQTCQFIPSCQCNIQESLVNEGLGNETLAITDMTAESASGDPNIVRVQWYLTYTGTDPNNRVTQRISYKPDGGKFSLIPGESVKYAWTSDHAVQYVLVDTTSWPYGGYTFLVEASAPDAENAARQTASWEKKGGASPNYIQLD